MLPGYYDCGLSSMKTAIENIFLAVPCLFGSQGVKKVLEVDLTDVEHSALINCEQNMRQSQV